MIADADIERLARRIWDYHQLHQPLAKADCILVMGSNDTRVAAWGARVFLDGWAPWLVCSGRQGVLTRDWDRTEAALFADVAAQHGVPRDRILVEDQATHTGENVRFTQRLLATRGVYPTHYLVVQKPYMERRAYATFRKILPDTQVTVTSPPLAFEEYPTAAISRDWLIHIMVGDLQRIARYPQLGFQIEQPIPPEVWSAYEQLVRAGYTRHLIAEPGTEA